jgi:hypothetical protein
MHTVFINYRRDDTAGEARGLFSELEAILGKGSVFMDVDTIALGRDFRQVLRERLESCDLMLALVGRNWVDAKNSSGQRRLEDPGDYVRLEIEAALKRNIPVTPVLVQGAQMPTVAQLPNEIEAFAYRNGFELSHNRWNSDVQEMIKRLGLSKQRDHKETGRKKSWPTIVGVSAVAIALVGSGVFYYRTVVEEKAKKAAAQAERERAAADEYAQLRADAVRTIRDTKLFAEMSTRSRTIATLPKGINALVVRSIGDWVEVKSKRGNSSGYVLREDVEYFPAHVGSKTKGQ